MRARASDGAVNGVRLQPGVAVRSEYVATAEQPGFDDSRFVEVTLPHTVTNLSWGDWNPAAWQKKWIYRKRFDTTALPPGRVFVDFHGVMASARYFLDGHDVGLHQGGYLPFSLELTSHVPRAAGPARACAPGELGMAERAS